VTEKIFIRRIHLSCRVRRDRVFSSRSRPSLTRQKSVPIPVPAKYFFGIFDAVTIFCEYNSSRLKPIKVFTRDSVVSIPFLTGIPVPIPSCREKSRDRDRVREKNRDRDSPAGLYSAVYPHII
jgi:hypothetical protein